jgi:hypothetical protein
MLGFALPPSNDDASGHSLTAAFGQDMIFTKRSGDQEFLGSRCRLRNCRVAAAGVRPLVRADRRIRTTKILARVPPDLLISLLNPRDSPHRAGPGGDPKRFALPGV